MSNKVGEVEENSLRKAGCWRKVQGRLKIFIHKGGERFWFVETIVREIGGRQMY